MFMKFVGGKAGEKQSTRFWGDLNPEPGFFLPFVTFEIMLVWEYSVDITVHYNANGFSDEAYFQYCVSV